MRAMGIRVVAVDAGSVRPPPKFAWVAFAPPAQAAILSGNDPQSAVSAVVAGLAWGGQAALLLASPPPDPVPADAGVLVTGLAPGTWMLSQLAAAVPGLSATTQPDQWQASASPLLLAEAFVAGSGKPGPRSAGQAAADAEAAGLALVALLNTSAPLAPSIGCSPHAPFNLLAAMAVSAGLGIDPSELSQDILVITAHPGEGNSLALGLSRPREDVDQVPLRIAEDHAAVSPRLGCRRQHPLDAERLDPLVFGVSVLNEEVENDLGPVGTRVAAR